MKTEYSQIKLSDGRLGKQTVWLHDDGRRELAEIVIHHTADGKPCKHIYGPRSFLQDGVFHFTDLGQVTWETIPGTTKIVD